MGGGFGKQPDAEQLEMINAANTEINKEAYKELAEILKKEQIARLKQIQRQQMGITAFTDHDTVEALKLSDSQKASVKGISGDYTKEANDIRKDAFGGKGMKFDAEKFQEVQKKVQKVQTEYVGKVVDVLDDGQKKTWKELLGEPFDLTKLTFGGFGKGKKDE